MNLRKLGYCVQVLSSIPTDDLLHEFQMNDALGPLLDPTGWIKIHENASKNEKVVQALAEFMKTVYKEWPDFNNANV